MRAMFRRLLAFFILSTALLGTASAQDREVPYWATIRATELNMRIGPSADYRIDWVYHRAGLPIRVLRIKEGWRYIEDPAGAKGWVVARLLSPDRGALVVGKGVAVMRADPAESAAINWRAEPGVVGALGDCEDGWCEFAVGKRTGWVRAERLWGVDGD